MVAVLLSSRCTKTAGRQRAGTNDMRANLHEAREMMPAFEFHLLGGPLSPAGALLFVQSALWPSGISGGLWTSRTLSQPSTLK